jgi:TonB family protein
VPKPLGVDTYDTRTSLTRSDLSLDQFAAITLRSFYGVALHRDGRLTNPRVVGGVRNSAFDRAVIDALVSLDTSRLLPAPPLAPKELDGDSLELRLTITPGLVWSGTRPARPTPATAEMEPLLQLHVPIRPVTRPIRPLPSREGPRYPARLRAAGVEGEVLAEALVDASGAIDPSSVQILRATDVDFVKAVLAFLPTLRFEPLMVAGCPVASLAQMPFLFGLQR